MALIFEEAAYASFARFVLFVPVVCIHVQIVEPRNSGSFNSIVSKVHYWVDQSMESGNGDDWA